MNINKIHEILIKEPKYRFQQVNKALFEEYISSWEEASALPKALRNNLEKKCPISIKAEVMKEGRTAKALISLEDDEVVETVLIRGKDKRNTVCVSSQIGCAMNCSFCATGQSGFTRNLRSDEIVEQVVYWNRYLKEDEEKVDNIVYMGMGEPFNNYAEFIKSVKFINNPETLNIGARRISVSTVGVIEGIKRIAGEKIQVNLAISLHAPNDNIREDLIPSASKYKINDILRATDDYIKKTGRRVMFEYMMIQGINDTDNHANELAILMRRPLYMVNLIPYNSTTAKYKASSKERMEEFKAILEDKKIAVTIRHSSGQDISAACGQLRTKKKMQ